MGHRYHASSNDGLVDNHANAEIIKSSRVIHAMKATDRAKYLVRHEGEEIEASVAYRDGPKQIDHEQTISAPHMHAYAFQHAADAIDGVEQPRILEVDAGSGYLTACLGRLGKTVVDNISSADSDLLGQGVVTIEQADGWHGLPTAAPFHFIHVGAAAVETPKALMDQLADGGCLLVPVGAPDAHQALMEIQRNGETFTERKLVGVKFVPLVREEFAEL
ncbi:hypothetical protein Poli38472_012619 [Pythium oligandrum]|uniref:protein-L-isoaspartate(D-aspartate) O-methyltransferase n=1 Tax=Pythium oligandrum TaxID=41045 RepID=A0A8K1CEA4_PYTOL|nr:hypothetical protein Poli38472_012619 [Pythium oligandrum]|eukprot:TMW61428.1 hypothetical protein Poli38472_012619 [Pythium oligandrum]